MGVWEIDLCNIKECLEVEFSVWCDKHVESYGGQVTHSHLRRTHVTHTHERLLEWVT